MITITAAGGLPEHYLHNGADMKLRSERPAPLRLLPSLLEQPMPSRATKPRRIILLAAAAHDTVARHRKQIVS